MTVSTPTGVGKPWSHFGTHSKAQCSAEIVQYMNDYFKDLKITSHQRLGRFTSKACRKRPEINTQSVLPCTFWQLSIK